MKKRIRLYRSPDKWDRKLVKHRFEDASFTITRLPEFKVPGYFNTWPDFVRTRVEKMLALQEKRSKLPPPSPRAISRLDEVCEWIAWPDVDERKIIWARSAGVKWKEIQWEMEFGKTKARTIWEHGLDVIVINLNYLNGHQVRNKDKKWIKNTRI